MKLREAEELLKAVKLQGPLTEPWSVETDEGIVLEAWPLGFARGCAGLRDLVEITMFPHWTLNMGGFYQGDRDNFIAGPRWNPRFLWEQERFVYIREMREAMQTALLDLDLAPFFPRWGEYSSGQTGSNSDQTPQPEDFHLYALPRAVRWTLQGRNDLPDAELEKIKQEFCLLLAAFIKEETWNGERKVVRVRSAASPEEDQGADGNGHLAQIGSFDSADDDDWN